MHPQSTEGHCAAVALQPTISGKDTRPEFLCSHPVAAPILPPQTRNDNCPRIAEGRPTADAEGRQVNLEGSSPGMAMNGNNERTRASCCLPVLQ